jgi:hypothetical protein
LLTKDKYIDAIHIRISTLLESYLKLRVQVKNSDSKKPEIRDEINRSYREMKDRMSVTKESIPQILRDIFELLVDSHSRKSLLVSKKYLDEQQKRKIRQAALYCCAFCGPDFELESNKLSCMFLDFCRIKDDEYEFDGLLICIKWYIMILESGSVKKEAEAIKKLKLICDEFEKISGEQKKQMAVFMKMYPPQVPVLSENSGLAIENSDANLVR